VVSQEAFCHGPDKVRLIAECAGVSKDAAYSFCVGLFQTGEFKGGRFIAVRNCSSNRTARPASCCQDEPPSTRCFLSSPEIVYIKVLMYVLFSILPQSGASAQLPYQFVA